MVRKRYKEDNIIAIGEYLSKFTTDEAREKCVVDFYNIIAASGTEQEAYDTITRIGEEIISEQPAQTYIVNPRKYNEPEIREAYFKTYHLYGNESTLKAFDTETHQYIEFDKHVEKKIKSSDYSFSYDSRMTLDEFGEAVFCLVKLMERKNYDEFYILQILRFLQPMFTPEHKSYAVLKFTKIIAESDSVQKSFSLISDELNKLMLYK